MEDIIVFLGSDHVIQKPQLDPVSHDLLLYTDKAAAAKTCRYAAGVLNTYRLNMATLQTKSIAAEGCSGIRILSPDALSSLSFLDAGFITL